ncbi:hypothetical protein [Paludisphaera sp.]|uniref:carboxypeptidase-like regulatory domain-containing protein n=1 Tax=Paludisphaera sp. TaxID=2017432 RepID=UPI00301E433E
MSPLQIARRLALLAPLALAGCGDPEDSYPLVPVTGKVTRDGGFVSGASVSFLPDPGNSYQTPGGATTDSSGVFVARFRDRDGLALGKYKVLVIPDDETPDVEVDASVEEAFKDDPIMLREMKRAGGQGGRKRKPPAASRKAEFDVEVVSGGLERDFELKQGASQQAEADGKGARR